MSEQRRLDPFDRHDPRYWLGGDKHRPGSGDYHVPNTGLGPAAGAVYAEAQRLMLGRHADYGPHNIAAAWPDPLTALAVRITDKLERIKNLLAKGEGDVYGERARDSWIDLANYALIGVLVIDGSWPELSARNRRKPLSKENHVPLGDHPRPAGTTA